MKQTLGIILLLVLPYVALGQYVKALPYDQITITKAFIKDTATIAIVLKKRNLFLLIKKARIYFKSH
jgi:hypothetical protein